MNRIELIWAIGLIAFMAVVFSQPSNSAVIDVHKEELIKVKSEIASMSLKLDKLLEKFEDTQVIYAEEVRMNDGQIK